jgi:hypothetical protein
MSVPPENWGGVPISQLDTGTGITLTNGGNSIIVPAGLDAGVQQSLASNGIAIVNAPTTSTPTSSSNSWLNAALTAFGLTTNPAMTAQTLLQTGTAQNAANIAGTAAASVVPAWLKNLSLSQIAIILIGFICLIGALFLFGFQAEGDGLAGSLGKLEK